MARCIGVISDTHGLLRDAVKEKLGACSLILHAGDVGGPSVLAELRQIAEVVAVRGNMDGGSWAGELAEMEYVEVEDTRICVIHNIADLALDAAAAGVTVVVHGHSHKSGVEHKDGVLYLNPGSAGPRRFDLPISMAILHVGGGRASAEILRL